MLPASSPRQRIPLAAIEPGQPVGFTDIGFFLIFFGAPMVAGRLFRHRAEREHLLVDEQETRTAEAIAEERARIARELHDVVAHAISVMVLQARGGRRMLAERPERDAAALDAIEHAGEQALVEMRRLLGDPARRRTSDAALAPQPGLGRLDDLVDGVPRGAGCRSSCASRATPVELPPGSTLSAYRIVQEALTNALKHAGPARATVVVRYGAEALELEVVDDGRGSARRRSRRGPRPGRDARARRACTAASSRPAPRPDGGFASAPAAAAPRRR